MRHLDEGALHEYLDMTEREASAVPPFRRSAEVEEHLAACAECQALLEDVKAIRSKASEILAASGPIDVDMPAFAEIRARARARKQPRRVLQYVRMKQLAWAATVVLAVAVGWYARGGLRSTTAERSTVDEPRPSTVAAAPVEQEADEAMSQVSTRAADEQPEPPTPQVEGRMRSEAREQVIAKGEEAQAVTGLPAAAPQPAVDPEARRDVPVQLAAEPQAAAGRGAAQPIDSVAQARQAIGAVDSSRAQYAGARRAQARVVSAENLAVRDQLELREGEMRDPIVWALSTADWTIADESGARDAFGGAVPTITDLPVVDYGIAGADVVSAVRVRQRLDTGEIVELIFVPGSQSYLLADVLAQQPGEVTVQNEMVGAEGVNAVVADRDGLRIVLRGAVDLAVLRQLVGAVGGGR